MTRLIVKISGILTTLAVMAALAGCQNSNSEPVSGDYLFLQMPLIGTAENDYAYVVFNNQDLWRLVDSAGIVFEWRCGGLRIVCDENYSVAVYNGGELIGNEKIYTPLLGMFSTSTRAGSMPAESDQTVSPKMRETITSILLSEIVDDSILSFPDFISRVASLPISPDAKDKLSKLRTELIGGGEVPFKGYGPRMGPFAGTLRLKKSGRAIFERR